MGLFDKSFRKFESNFDKSMQDRAEFRDQMNGPPDKSDLHLLNQYVFTHKSVIVKYRLNPKTFVGVKEALLEEERDATFGDKGAHIQRMKSLIDADQDVDLADYEDVLAIKVIDVRRGKKSGGNYPGSVIGWSDE